MSLQLYSAKVLAEPARQLQPAGGARSHPLSTAERGSSAGAMARRDTTSDEICTAICNQNLPVGTPLTGVVDIHAFKDCGWL